MSNNNIAWAIIAAVALIGIYYYFSQKEQRYLAVTNFQECVDAGYPVMESYPEQCKTPDNRNFVNPNQTVNPTPVATSTATTTSSGNMNEKSNLVRVSNIVPNQLITSPLKINGEARGYWYFEASFPVELLDGNGKQLTIKPAQASGEWMTENFVPFSITLTFTQPTTSTGTLILHKDNPSGDPERDDSLRIPVRFN